MLKETVSSWTIGLYSFAEISQFTPMVSNLWDKETFNIAHVHGTKIKKSDILVGYLIIFWIILYFIYEKCLNVSLNYFIFLYYVIILINEFVNYFFFFLGYLQRVQIKDNKI